MMEGVCQLQSHTWGLGTHPDPTDPLLQPSDTHTSCLRRLSWALALVSCRAKWCEGPSVDALAGASGNSKWAGSRSSSSSANR